MASIDAREGAALCQGGDFRGAIPLLSAAAARSPKATTMYNLGLALLKERRAEEALANFSKLLEVEPGHAAAASARDAAQLMVDGGDYVTADEAAAGDENGGGAAATPPPFAPTKRIYEIARDKGVGQLAAQDDMVNLLSGIEEWVGAALGPLEARVAGLEAAALAQGGVVGSASEDRALLSMLFERVQDLEGAQATATAAAPPAPGAPPPPPPPNGGGLPPPAFAAQFDAAASSRLVTMNVGSLDRRVKALEKVVLGSTSQSSAPQLGGGLLNDARDDGDDDGAAAAAAKTPEPSSAMSVTARLAVQEQRMEKMAADLEAQSKLIADLLASGGGGHHRPSPFGDAAPSARGLRHQGGPPRKSPIAAHGPDMISELKAATRRRAAKRRELGLTLLE